MGGIGSGDRSCERIDDRLRSTSDEVRRACPSFRPAQGPGVRVDTFVEDGTQITPHYDSLLAKLVVWDVDRPAAIARALRSLEETVIDGVPSTRELAIRVLESLEFARGEYSTAWHAKKRKNNGWRRGTRTPSAAESAYFFFFSTSLRSLSIFLRILSASSACG